MDEADAFVEVRKKYPRADIAGHALTVLRELRHMKMVEDINDAVYTAYPNVGEPVIRAANAFLQAFLNGPENEHRETAVRRIAAAESDDDPPPTVEDVRAMLADLLDRMRPCLAKYSAGRDGKGISQMDEPLFYFPVLVEYEPPAATNGRPPKYALAHEALAYANTIELRLSRAVNVGLAGYAHVRPSQVGLSIHLATEGHMRLFDAVVMAGLLFASGRRPSARRVAMGTAAVMYDIPFDVLERTSQEQRRTRRAAAM